MGDRGNIFVVDAHFVQESEMSLYHGVFLYTHWGGYELKETLAEGLRRGENRWDDPAYLTRIIFDTMTGGDRGETGYGISAGICDNEYPILRVLVPGGGVFDQSNGSGRVDVVSDALCRDPKATPAESYSFPEFIAKFGAGK